MFPSTTIIRELLLKLAKVIFILKHSIKYVVICYYVYVILPSVLT